MRFSTTNFLATSTRQKLPKIFAAFILTFLLFPASSFAASAFSGKFSMALNLDTESTTAKLKYDYATTNSNSSVNFNGLGRQSINGHIEAQYDFGLGRNILLGIGGTYDIANTNLLSVSANISQSGSTPESGHLDLNEKDHYSIFIEPGYALSHDTVIYGKLAYHHAIVYDSGYWYHAGSAVNGFVNASVSGLGFGIGIKSILDRNFYVQVEAQRIDYNDYTVATTFKDTTGTTLGSIGLGYIF